MKELLTNHKAWTEISANYDQGARRRLSHFSREALDWADLGSEDHVLDVACGPGTLTELAAPKVAAVQAVDFSSGMIEVLRERTKSMSNVSSTVGNGQRLELAGESYDAAFSMFGLMFFPDPHAGLRELHRVLKPGAQVFISSWVPMAESPTMKPMFEAISKALPRDPDSPPPKPFPFETPESLSLALSGAGFESTEAKVFTPEIEVESPEAYWAEMSDRKSVV